jgi:hypothetical protein
MVRRPSYVAVPGSDRLRTRKRGASVAAPVEQAAPASLKRVEVEVAGGRVIVGPALLQGPQVPLLLEVTDRLGPLLSAESFVVYVQLYRLAVAHGKNAHRIGLAELERRCGLRGRRLNKAIADAVATGALVLIDRTRDGTLYRVRLPGEVLDEAPTVLPMPSTTMTPSMGPSSPKVSSSTARAKRASAPTVPPTLVPTTLVPATVVPTQLPTTLVPTTATEARGPRSVGDVCRWFEQTHGGGPGRRGADVAAAVMALLEEGETFATIPAVLSAFVATAPQTTPLTDLDRWR